jgi:type I restriction enzyme S subunit
VKSRSAWKIEPLGELCDFQRGLTYAKCDEVDVSDNIVLRANNVDLRTNLLDFKELRYISDSIIVPDSKKVKKDTLVICTASGSKSHLGKVAFIDDDYDHAFGGFMGMITPKNCILPRYLFHRMTSGDYKDFIEKLSDGANINNLKFSDLKAFLVPYPPLPEQKRIVAILDEAFAGIGQAIVNTERNLQNARELFESYLNGVFTRKNEGWAEKKLKEICTFSSGGTPSKNNPSYWIGEIPWVSGKDMKTERMHDAILHISNTAVNESASRIAPIGSLLILVRGMGLANGIPLAEVTSPCAFNQDIKAIQPNTNIIPRFLLLAIKAMISTHDRLLENAAHGTLKINSENLRNISVPIPSPTTQKIIADKLDKLRENVVRLESIYQKKLEALTELKQSILQKAFSGELTDDLPL